MGTSINALVQRLDTFLFELGSLQYRYGAGLSSELPLEKLYRNYPEVAQTETFLEVKQAVLDPRTDEGARARLKLLLEFLAGQVEDSLSASADEAVAALEATAVVPFGEGPLPFREAMARLPREPSREARDQLERGIGQFLWENQTPFARRREMAAITARQTGYSSYLELRSDVTGYSAEAMVQECADTLSQTEDAYRDLLGYVLKKLDPNLRSLPSGAARRHDLQHAATAPWMAQHFPRNELVPSVTRCLSDMGLPPNAQGRIVLDTEDRPGKSARAFVADLRVPDDIRLVVRPGGGLDDYFALLHEFGHAQQLANVSSNVPVEERRLGDLSVTEGFAYLFDHLLLDEAWHKRYLRLPANIAREAARLAAFNNLWLLRRYAAKLGYEVELYRRGPERALAEEYEARMRSALMVGIHRGNFLHDVDPQLYSSRYLRAWALEARLHAVLQERFNEDFWRNPATGTWLKGLFARGQRDDAAKLSLEVSGRPLSLSEAGQRLIRIMAA